MSSLPQDVLQSNEALHPAHWPDRVFVSNDALEDPLTQRVLSRLPHITPQIIENGQDPVTESGLWASPSAKESELFTRGKRGLLLTRYLGNWLKACPGTSSHVCCNLWIVNPGEGCPMDCTYCYLQSYLRRNPTLKLFSNVPDMLEAIRQRAQTEPKRLFRVGTGEIIDSLIWDELTDLTLDLVPFFARSDNLMLELKSKADCVDNLVLLKNEHAGKTIVSWSVNAREITRHDEAGTASLEQRIAAAQRVIEAGYRVGFHFDPMIHFSGWEDGYRDVVQYIFSRIPVESVAWVSVSTLRYKRDLQQMMLERFPKSKIPFGEQFLAKDGKLRYIQPLRFKMLNFIWQELKAVHPNMPTYMCMESSAAWRTVAGGPPIAGSELTEVFTRNLVGKGRLPILKEPELNEEGEECYA